MKLQWYCCALATLVMVGGCGHGSSNVLLGKWTNQLRRREAARDRVDRVPAEKHCCHQRSRHFRSSGMAFTDDVDRPVPSHSPNRLKITEELGSAVLDYDMDGTRLVLSGDRLAQLLGKREVPQTLDKASQ